MLFMIFKKRLVENILTFPELVKNFILESISSEMFSLSGKSAFWLNFVS